jgi:glycerol 3-phosphatase-2
VTPPTLAGRFDGLVVDLDGVVWVGGAAVPGAVEALGALRAAGKRVLFLTNDPRSSRADYAARLCGLGFPTSADDILTSSAATADFLHRREGLAERTAFVVGSPALRAEIDGAGLLLLDRAGGVEAEVVVVGGHEGFDYAELRIAAQAVRRGARFYATGRDAVFPMPDGPWPGWGAGRAAVERGAGGPATVVGKPEPLIFEVARARLAGCRRIGVVGDDLKADVAGGKRAGLETVLVLTGNASAEDVKDAVIRPDFVCADLAAFTGLGPTR